MCVRFGSYSEYLFICFSFSFELWLSFRCLFSSFSFHFVSFTVIFTFCCTVYCIPGIVFILVCFLSLFSLQCLRIYTGKPHTRGASPRRADARLGFAHARNYPGYRQIDAVNATVLSIAKGSIKNKSSLNAEKEKAGIKLNEPANKWPSGTRCRTPAARIRSTAALQQQHSSTATHRAAAAAAAAAAALCMHIKLTSRLLRWHLNHHRTYFYTGNKYIAPTI